MNASPKASPAGGPVKPSAQSKSRILLVDDHPITRQGVRALLDLRPDLEICGETDSAPEAVSLFSKLRPDLALVDISLKNGNGLELTKTLRAMSPSCRILILSMHDENLYAERAMRAGAMGYLMKQEASENIVVAIKQVLAGEIYLSPSIKERLLYRFITKNVKATPSVDALSDREIEVLHLLGYGYSTRQIATKLNLATKTIDSYREHLKLKLNLTSGAELVRYAIQWAKDPVSTPADREPPKESAEPATGQATGTR